LELSVKEILDDFNHNPIVQTFIQDQLKFPQQFPSVIDENDEMYLFSLKNVNGNRETAWTRYYSLGKRIFEAVKQIIEWHFQRVDNISSFLDFASGYGRFTRFLLQEFPAEQVWVSDIYQAAVEFQIKQFGVNGFVSTEYPKNYFTERQFDCILASSFFSHIPETNFADWLEKLYSLLSHNGILIFSVHDLALLPAHVAEKITGIYFIPESESKTLDKQLYGTSYVSQDFVGKIISKILGAEAQLCRIKKGLCGHQDLYIMAKNSQKDFSSCKFSYHPEGRLDSCNITPSGDIHLSGWVADLNQDGHIEDIQILVNGKIVQRCFPNGDRPDLPEHLKDMMAVCSGWSCYLESGSVSLDDVVMIKAINSKKFERVLEIKQLGSMLA
jgi:SAM-dependent methyltransferase